MLTVRTGSVKAVPSQKPVPGRESAWHLWQLSDRLASLQEGSVAESEKSRDSAELSEDETSEMSEFDVPPSAEGLPALSVF